MHGANRLGCNSTAECLVWGGITGGEIASISQPAPPLSRCLWPKPNFARKKAAYSAGLLQQKGTEKPAAIRRELRTLMDKHAGVYRTGESMQ